MLGRLVHLALRPLSAERMARLLSRLARGWSSSHPPRDAARFLFDLDNRLYLLQGEAAVRLGGGLHTKHRHMRYHDFFVERIRGGETVLDIGCGVGAVAHDVAARSGARVTGIDLSGASIAEARRRFAHPQATFVEGDALRDLPGHHFDVVILSNVLEHIEHRVDFLRQVQAQATPKRFLIRVPLFERDWRVPLKRELGLDSRLDPTHFTEYTLESFHEEMRAAGLRPTHLEVRWGEIWAELVPDAA